MLSCVPGAADPFKIRVNIFPGPQNLALYIAIDQGFLDKRGLAVDIQITPSSREQREGLVNGAFDIAQSGVDNAVALVDAGKADVIIAAGGSNGMNEFMVRPEIRSFADLRGRNLVVDAPDTSFALLAYEMLARNGVPRDAYQVLPAGGCPQRLAALRADPANAGAMLNLPCRLIAAREGFHSLGNAVEVLGPYQGDGVFLLRAWAAAHPEALVGFLQAAIEARRWAALPEHHQALVALAARVLQTDAAIAAEAVEIAFGATPGVARDLRFDAAGFATALRLRALWAGGDPKADPAKYLDLGYHARALAGL